MRLGHITVSSGPSVRVPHPGKTPAAMAGRTCPFPSRTRKPSSLAPMILPLAGKQAAAGFSYILRAPPLARGLLFFPDAAAAGQINLFYFGIFLLRFPPKIFCLLGVIFFL